MKKKIIVIMTLLTLICSFALFAACDFTGDSGNTGGNSGDVDNNETLGSGEEEEQPVVVTNVTLAQETLTLEIGQEVELGYTVEPAEGMIDWVEPNGNLIEATLENGKFKIKALTAGSGDFSLRAKRNSSIYSKCAIKVNPPEGYFQYERNVLGIKFLVPDGWKSVQAPNVTLCYQDANTGHNINLINQTKTNSFLSITADVFKEQIVKTYGDNSLDINVTYCQVEKYDSNRAFHAVIEYNFMVGGQTLSYHQEQFIRNTSRSTMLLTLTYTGEFDSEYSNILRANFQTW